MDNRSERAQELANRLTAYYHQWAQDRLESGDPNVDKADFGRWLGIPETTRSAIMRGERIPAHETLDKIAPQVGVWVYDVAGVPRRETQPQDKRLRFINKIWDHLTEEDKIELTKDAQQRAESKDDKRDRELQLSFS